MSQPMGSHLLKALVNFAKTRPAAKAVGEPLPNIGNGVSMALGLLLIIVFSSICQHQRAILTLPQFFSRSMTTGVLVCVALTGALIVTVAGGLCGIVHICILAGRIGVSIECSEDTVGGSLAVGSHCKHRLLDSSTQLKMERDRKFVSPLLTALLRRIDDDTEIPPFIESVINSPTAPAAVLKHLTNLLITKTMSEDGDVPACHLLTQIFRNASTVVTSISLAVALPASASASETGVGGVVASMSVDERARTSAVKELLASAQDNAVEQQPIHAALVARVQETSAIVLNARKPKRPLLRLHLGFLLGHFCSAATPEVREDVFHNILLPFPLLSKARQHTADLVRELISQSPLVQYDLVAGCAEVWAAEKGKGKEEDEGEGDATERMAQINEAVAEKLADKILASDRYAAHFSDLIHKSQETDPHVRVCTYLAMRDLLSRLSGTRALDASAQLLEAINLIPRPAGLALDWFKDESAALSEGSLYVKLIRTVYERANSTFINSLLTVGLLATIFSYLKDDALAFLACVWTTFRDSTPDVCVLALRHAAAFLEAHNKEADSVDLQTILPALVICLPSADPETRTAALDCIAVQRNLVEQHFSAVYAFDAIYGESEAKLQYLAQSDIKKYLDAMMDHREHIALDASYVKVFHVQHLGGYNEDKKKDSKHQRNVLCYILSHAHVLRLLPARIALLQCVEDISDKSLSKCSFPSYSRLAKTTGSTTAVRTVLLQKLEHGLVGSLTLVRLKCATC
ncbi:hypothetical protein B0H14DRAFT_3175398 [Mycena olivaceomarginata]|nr:hypothetical protein B0H14DRAFT_3175398 [Mycena olivaceomarginata]